MKTNLFSFPSTEELRSTIYYKWVFFHSGQFIFNFCNKFANFLRHDSLRKIFSCKIGRKRGLSPTVSLYSVKIFAVIITIIKHFSNCLVLINYNNPSYLHWTSSVATSYVDTYAWFPTLLLALHRYFPLSVRLRLVIVKCFWFPEKRILELLILVSTENPFMNHDIVGAGFPVALQDKVTLSPSDLVTSCEWAVNSGGSVSKQQQAIAGADPGYHRSGLDSRTAEDGPQ